jgi:hypothetical protein
MSAVQPPRQLERGAPPELQRVHGEINELRDQLARLELVVRKAAATDPDVMFGVVRSSRYRVAVRRMSWSLDQWLDARRPELEALRAGCDALDRVQLAAQWLECEARTIAHTRALEGFELDRVQRAAEVMARCRHAMWDWQGVLELSPRKPYRHEAVELRAARAV